MTPPDVSEVVGLVSHDARQQVVGKAARSQAEETAEDAPRANDNIAGFAEFRQPVYPEAAFAPAIAPMQAKPPCPPSERSSSNSNGPCWRPSR